MSRDSAEGAVDEVDRVGLGQAQCLGALDVRVRRLAGALATPSPLTTLPALPRVSMTPSASRLPVGTGDRVGRQAELAQPRWRTVGSFVPGASTPLETCSRTCSRTCSYGGTGELASTVIGAMPDILDHAVRLLVDMTVYLDHAATTPILTEAAAAMTSQLGRVGNASSLHGSGRDARRLVEESRETIARALGCRPVEVVFTSGGTESDNLAVKGLFWARRAEDPRRVRILSTPVEHHAVLDPLHWLGVDESAKVELVAVDRLGRLDVDAFRMAVESDPESVALVTVMWANNEVGTVQPVAEIVEIAHAHGIPVHTDAVQALGQLPLDFGASGVDAMTVTGHKIGGPYGVGALVVRRELQPTALLHGGGQERDIRSGTIDTPAIAGFAAACRLAVEAQPELAGRLTALRDALVEGVRREVPDAVYNGDPEDGPEHRLPGNAHLQFPGCEGDSLLMLLDARGIECSTGSACDAGVPQASHVLLAMGASEEAARSSLRFSLGHTSTQSDVDALIEAIGPVVERARNAALSTRMPAHGRAGSSG